MYVTYHFLQLNLPVETEAGILPYCTRRHLHHRLTRAGAGHSLSSVCVLTPLSCMDYIASIVRSPSGHLQDRPRSNAYQAGEVDPSIMVQKWLHGDWNRPCQPRLRIWGRRRCHN